MDHTTAHYLVDFGGSTPSHTYASPLTDLLPLLAPIRIAAYAVASADDIAAAVRTAVDYTLTRHGADATAYQVRVDLPAGQVRVVDADDEEIVYARATVTGPGVGQATTPAEHPHADLIAGLRELAALLESRPDLPVGRIPVTVGIGPVPDLTGWSEALGEEPYLSGRIPMIRRDLAPHLNIRVQARAATGSDGDR